MIDIDDAPVRDYGDAPKYRAVLWQYFSPQERTRREREIYTAGGGSQADAELYFPDPPILAENELVVQSIEWVFKQGRQIKPGRFNDATFAALYTAKEPQTATEELRHWHGAGLEYVIFDVSFTGDAMDLRPAITDGQMRWPLNHSDCQPLGDAARAKAAALACFSARRSGGSCCAIFSASNVTPGGIFDRGIL